MANSAPLHDHISALFPSFRWFSLASLTLHIIIVVFVDGDEALFLGPLKELKPSRTLWGSWTEKTFCPPLPVYREQPP